jgi:NNP family nitrate/nitrite transporter-like MFS transporter
MGGTAISNFTTVKLVHNVGPKDPFFLVAALLAVYAVVAFALLREAPGRTPSPVPP